eukprot:CAMPEP_0170154532 /NCGR_PEP_ID=MMETSP0033_2-20121228/58175_1 /TAXON_ID=195969 /ORGANISM="Dolichomastix tenuilepis, Strain CCMP3274" /LENGTH=73 /DNA_ID=CAMNT_0010391785 /DNA_START=42 /DNA_END=259 /DNA_ORIENTATION=+
MTLERQSMRCSAPFTGSGGSITSSVHSDDAYCSFPAPQHMGQRCPPSKDCPRSPIVTPKTSTRANPFLSAISA